jgi:aarF domain-containing kinase
MDDDGSRTAQEIDLMVTPMGRWESLGDKSHHNARGIHPQVPEHWAAALAKLQDELPPSPRSYVRGLLSQEFRRPFAEIFQKFEFTPLASASVAQVHRATLADGRDVVVKVQHQGVRDLMTSDMKVNREHHVLTSSWRLRLRNQNIGLMIR